MLRIILSIIIGYIAIALIVFAGLTTAWLVLGADGAFMPGTFELTTTWAVTAVGVNLFAAILGGVVCASIARKSAAWLIFAAIVFVLGVLVAIPQIIGNDEAPDARPAEITMPDAMKQAVQPTWFCVMNPFTAAIGIVIGGMLVSLRSKPSP